MHLATFLLGSFAETERERRVVGMAMLTVCDKVPRRQNVERGRATSR